jgi:hypothetical protein
MSPKKKNKNKPKQGWVVELKEAEREVKTANQATPEQHLRVARAARKLRIWKKSKTAAEIALSIDPHGPLRAQLIECQKQSDAELSIPSDVDTDVYKAIPEGCDLNDCVTPHPIFSNLNFLQCATMNGDVRLLEDLVAYGVAIDYPISNSSTTTLISPGAEAAPKGSTALVLCCAHLAAMAWLAKREHGPRTPDDERQDEVTSRMVECAILLVKLGADFRRKFILDPPPKVSGPLLSGYRSARSSGKTAQQLAQMALRPELVKAMEELQSKEKLIALVSCRCGSRLPWKECHAGNDVGESPFYSTADVYRGRLAWRYSPSARCPCRHTKKTHYKCCWKESCRPYYLDDSDGFISKSCECLDGECCKGQEQDELLQIRQETAIAKDDHQSHIIKHLEGELFRWTSRHWLIPKAELLVMVKSWNIALEKHCDEAGLTGSDRASVIEMNRATPHAPCGNASCTNVETKVKDFRKCSKCKMIAYCSSECQRKGWKDHRGICHAT